MRTVITDSIPEAAEIIRRGDLVAFPTETVYGLGADATDPEAVAKIFEAKNRPADNPLIVHIADFVDLTRVTRSVSPSAMALLDAFFPGPLTLILDRHPELPDSISAGLSTVGVRMPDHETAAALIRASGCPIVAPSANLSGRPSPTTWQAVKEDLDGKIACILRGEQTSVGLESTVVDCTRNRPVVLRLGGVTPEQLREVDPEILISAESVAPRSPGLRHRHYAPKARVVLVDSVAEAEQDQDSAFIGLESPDDPSGFALVSAVSDVEDYAFRVFEFFRACDRLGVGRIFCQRVRPENVGAALMDRLERAARR